MAYTINLYPSSDVSLEHTASSGNVGYALINEAEPDSGTTYIYQTLSSSNATVTSEFSCAPSSEDNPPTGKIKLKSITVETYWTSYGNNYADSVTGTLTPSVSFGGGSYTAGTEETKTSKTANYTLLTSTFSDLPEEGTVYESIDELNAQLRLVTRGRYTG